MILEPQTLTRPRISRHEEKSDQQDFPQTIPVSRAKDQSLRYHKMQARVHRLHRLHQQTAFTSVTQPNDDTDSDVPRVSVNSNPGTHCTNISGNLDIRRSTMRQMRRESRQHLYAVIWAFVPTSANLSRSQNDKIWPRAQARLDSTRLDSILTHIPAFCPRGKLNEKEAILMIFHFIFRHEIWSFCFLDSTRLDSTRLVSTLRYATLRYGVAGEERHKQICVAGARPSISRNKYNKRSQHGCANMFAGASPSK